MNRIEVRPVNLSINEQIDWLNDKVRCYIAPSKIHGIGVFSLKTILKGESAYLLPQSLQRQWFTVPYSRFKDLHPRVAEVILTRWPSVINGSAFLAPNDDVWMFSFINHFDDFNYDQVNDVAVKNIAEDEEITEDYKVLKNYQKVYPWLEKTPDNASTAEKSFGSPMARIIPAMLRRLVKTK